MNRGGPGGNPLLAGRKPVALRPRRGGNCDNQRQNPYCVLFETQFLHMSRIIESLFKELP